MKPVIIAIVGRSGNGKTYMAEFLRKKMNIPTIVSYTTRRKRPGETDGMEHFFIGSEQVPEGDDMLAYTEVNSISLSTARFLKVEFAPM